MTHTIEQGTAHEAPTTGTDLQQPPRRSRRTVLGWAAVAMGLVAAVVLLLLTITSDPSPQRITDPTPAEDSVVGGPRRVSQAADGAERYSPTSRAPARPVSQDRRTGPSVTSPTTTAPARWEFPDRRTAPSATSPTIGSTPTRVFKERQSGVKSSQVQSLSARRKCGSGLAET